MSHYFIENPEILTKERKLTLEALGHKFQFLSNNGLFSHDKIDSASLLLLENIPPIEEKSSLLDLGCGYGLLGIVLAKAYNLHLTQSDINSIALEYAAKNARLNNVTAKAIHSDSFTGITDSFSHITLNPPIHAGKETMYRMYNEAALHLLPGGLFYVVIQKKHGAESTQTKLEEIFPYVSTIYKKKGCFIFQCCIARR